MGNPRTEAELAINALSREIPPYWGNVRFDAVTMAGAMNYLKSRKPRVLYVMLGDTDEWAHERRYDLYLDAARRGDRFLRMLWQTVQTMPEYRGRTALLVATDHGRGSSRDWTDHGREVPSAERIWMAGLTGNRERGAGSGNFTQSQFAATIAASLGLEDAFRKAHPNAAASVLKPR